VPCSPIAWVRCSWVALRKECDKSPLVQARLSLGLVATFLGLLALLHFLEPEFNSGHLISEYQLGRHGWMMSLAFCSFGIGAMLLAQGLPPHPSTRSGRLGLRGLWLIGWRSS
jgi:hypothetical protein